MLLRVRQQNVGYQRVSPHSHHRNAAKHAIQKWKNHFISVLSSLNSSFPTTEWGHLIPKFDITLNYLRSSQRQPHLSAHACLFGKFDFIRTPLSVPGTKILVHETPTQCRTFSPHGIEGCYIGPSLDHYHCYK